MYISFKKKKISVNNSSTIQIKSTHQL